MLEPYLARLLFAVALPMAFCASAEAGVLVVDPGAAGAYASISAAVATAVDGDLVLVKSGSYAGFTVTNRALDLVADDGANVIVNGTIQIVNVAATREVSLSGFDVRALAGANALVLSNCTGSVRVQDCTLLAGAHADCSNANASRAAARLVNALDVSFARCTLTGAAAEEEWLYGGDGGSGVDLLGARCAFYDSTLVGGRGADFRGACTPLYGYGYGGQGGPGLSAFNTGFVFASRSTFTGGRGGDLVGFTPGTGGFEGCAGPGWSIAGFPGGAQRVLDTLLAAGGNGAPHYHCGAPQALAGGPAPRTLAGIARSVSASRVTRELGVLHLDFAGQPGDQVELVLAERSFFLDAPALRGVNLVRHTKPQPVMLAGIVPASGTLTLDLPIAELGPGVASRRFVAQALFVEPGGAATLSTPAVITLLDAAY